MSARPLRQDHEPEAAGAEGASGGLGARLRLARERARMTVRGLAREAGVSPSLISQIEHGRVMPSVGTLYALANQLGLSVDDLFSNTEQMLKAAGRETTPASSQDPVQRHHNRQSIRLASGVRWELLTPRPDKEVEFLRVIYDVGGESCPADALTRHGGTEYAYVLSGRLGVQVGFEKYELGPGDSMSFDAQMPHRLWTIGDEPATAIWVVLNRKGDARMRPPPEIP